MTEKLNNAIQQAVTIEELTDLIASLTLKSTATGRASFVVASKGDEVKIVFKVVDAASLVISNNLDGTVNPAFPEELQPRDRTRMASKLQVHKIAADLRPAQLTDSGMSSHGSPIVGHDHLVESGNGRTMGIWRAYQQGQADTYRQHLIDNAHDFGLDPAVIAQMDAPVPVSERIPGRLEN